MALTKLDEQFPPELLNPWRARVAETLPAHWQAEMAPVFPGGPVIWRLIRKGQADVYNDPPKYRFVIEGIDRDRLIDAAQNFDRAYI